MKIKRPSGMFGFTIVWIGQVVSLIGSSMSGFALTIWAWQVTGQATALALVGFFTFAPTVLISPVAGALVDRWNRKLVMMISDLASGLSTIAILILYHQGALEIWHLYVAGAFSGIFQAFQWPAYSAAISVMIPKQHYTRAGGMMSLAEWGSTIFAPALASALLAVFGLAGVLFIDIATFTFAVLALLLVVVPQPKETEEGRASRGSLWQESMYGFRYILSRPSLLGVQMVFFFGNFLGSLGGTLINPMVLARTANSSAALAAMQSIAGVGGVLGSVIITAWGGPKRKILGVLLGWAASGFIGYGLLGFAGGLVYWSIASFISNFVSPVVNSSNQAIWQSKVPPDIQGKVFSIRRLIAQVTGPLAMLISGPLADKVFEPAMRTEGSTLSQWFGWFTGVGPGAGMGAILAVCGCLLLLVGLVPFGIPAIRNIETILPDHDQS